MRTLVSSKSFKTYTLAAGDFARRHWGVLGWSALALAGFVLVMNPGFLWANLAFEVAGPTQQLSVPSAEAVAGIDLVRMLKPGARQVVAIKQPAPEVQLPKGLGISNVNLAKIPVALVGLTGSDADTDGLPDAVERSLGTNSQLKDTDKDGYPDAVEISNGYDPLGKGKLSFDNKLASKLEGKYLLQVQGHGEMWLVQSGKRKYVSKPELVGAPVATTLEQKSGLMAEPDTLYIQSLGISVPVKYVDEPTEQLFQAALVDGVVHYPGTALPGDPGNMYVFGHSSDYKWSKVYFKTVFAVLPRIKVGADIIVSDATGRAYTYRVKETVVAASNDVHYLDQYGYKQKILTVQTSYPVGTALKRYLAIAELVE